MKISSESSADVLHNIFNDMLKTGNFPENLKLADITLAFKKKDPLQNVNYKPVTFLPSILKVFGELMQKQITGHISNYLSPYIVQNKLYCHSLETGKKYQIRKFLEGLY